MEGGFLCGRVEFGRGMLGVWILGLRNEGYVGGGVITDVFYICSM